jgi:hypothetical protein
VYLFTPEKPETLSAVRSSVILKLLTSSVVQLTPDSTQFVSSRAIPPVGSGAALFPEPAALEADVDAAVPLGDWPGWDADAAAGLDAAEPPVVEPPVVEAELQAVSNSGTHRAKLILTAVLRPCDEPRLLLI